MIVVAIIGILASVAVPQYETYTAKSKVSTVYNTMAASKAPISAFYNLEGVMPVAGDMEILNALGLIDESDFTDTTAITTFSRTGDDVVVLVATFDGINSRVDTQTMTLTYTFTTGGGSTADVFDVTCTTDFGATKQQYLPKPCKI